MTLRKPGLLTSGGSSRVGRVGSADDYRLGEQQQVVVALEIALPVGEALAAIVLLLQFVALDHGAHGTVQDQDALLEQVGAEGEARAAGRGRAGHERKYRVAAILARPCSA